MSVNDGEKIFDKHFSPETGLIDKQKTVLTSGLTKFRRNDIQKLLNAQWWKKRTLSKKTSSKNLLGYVVSKCDKFADCFFDKKNRYFSVQFRKNMKKNKQHLCQNNVLSSNFSSGHVESSFVKLTERFSEKNRQIFAECP